ncbi:MAG: 2-hydroxy-3-oxopropionate reductase [Chloroflexota bacterium]|nr:2-hydroxy-3-oxopropionate reductase [Chloroflexota bacterium]
MAERIGFIGLGIMGKPMAHHLMDAGYALTVYSRSRGPVDEIVAEGATAAASPSELAERSAIVITMLPDSPDVQAVVAGEDGVLSGAREGALIIDMSTISPITARDLAAQAREQGVGMLDSPVSGGDVGARNATLSIMVGGSAEDFARAEPLFGAMGKTITHVGPAGAGQVVKACNQVVVALVLEAVSEALVLGSKAGVDPATIIQVLSGGMAATRVMEMRGANFLEHNFAPGFKVDLHHKDLGIALATAREYGVSLPLTGIVEQMLQALRTRGMGGSDHSALLTLTEEWAQHRIGQQGPA